MLMNGHLQIETSKLAQVSSGVGILGTKDRTGLKHTFETRGGGANLLVQLRTHRQTGWLTKVVEGKDISSTLGSTGNELGSMNLDKPLLHQAFAKETANHTLDAEDRLIGWCAEIEPTIVETHLLTNANHAIISNCFLVVFVVSTNIGFFAAIRTASILHLEWQGSLGLSDSVKFGDLNFHHFLSRRPDRLVRYSDDSLHIDNTLGRQIGNVLDHGSGDSLGFKANTLDGVQRRPDQDEDSLTDQTHRLKVTTHQDILTSQIGEEFLNGRPNLVRHFVTLHHLGVSEVILTDTSHLFSLLSLSPFALGTLGHLLGLFLCLSTGLGFVLGLVLLRCFLNDNYLLLLLGRAKVLASRFLEFGLQGKHFFQGRFPFFLWFLLGLPLLYSLAQLGNLCGNQFNIGVAHCHMCVLAVV
mmetsp:Transcript_8410/g.13922  ORF Transcript_8410/g.13922 Transcript_8410/m.13922 type:complete len:413 (-) Transcript_8410:42-1280(-)